MTKLRIPVLPTAILLFLMGFIGRIALHDYHNFETVMVSVGDKINQGDIIGTVGSTGRSTGPHLDFRVNWFQVRLDPMSVLKKNEN